MVASRSLLRANFAVGVRGTSATFIMAAEDGKDEGVSRVAEGGKESVDQWSFWNGYSVANSSLFFLVKTRLR